jgi:hypothetical protein
MALEAIAKYKQLLGIAIAAVILSVIFVPFQTADAFTVEIDLPDSDDDTVTQSPQGEPFEITIDVEAGELISIESIELILDNEESSVKRAIYNSTGDRTDGSTSLTVGSTVEIDASGTLDDTGYGYGFGLVSDGTTFIPNYQYSFTYSNAFIGGNAGGINNSGDTDFVTGLVGPGTITISGHVRTADLAEGTHTLDVLIDTGANGNDEDQLVAPQLSFDVEEAEGLENVEESVPAGTTEITVELGGAFGDAPVEITFDAATTSTGNLVVSAQQMEAYFDSLSDDLRETYALEDDGTFVSLTDENGDENFIAGFIYDIDLSALGLPEGTLVTLGFPYEDSDLIAAEEEALRLVHFNDDTEEWELLTNDDPGVNGGDEVDTAENIVYGTADDFSLFAPVFSAGTSGGGGSGGGGGGGSGGSVIINQTFPPSYFIDHPLSRVQVEEATIATIGGTNVLQGSPGQQVSLNAGFKNFQTTDQDYAIIFVVIDENGVTSDMGWVTGTLAPGQDTEASRSWTVGTEGDYTIRIFVWNGVSDLPTPLSEVTQKSFTSS